MLLLSLATVVSILHDLFLSLSIANIHNLHCSIIIYSCFWSIKVELCTLNFIINISFKTVPILDTLQSLLITIKKNLNII